MKLYTLRTQWISQENTISKIDEFHHNFRSRDGGDRRKPQAGRQLARDVGLAEPGDFQSGLKAAMAAADALGASTEAIAQPDGVLVRNYSCPLGSAVREEKCVCRALAAFFSEATGRLATEQCLRDDRLLCQYLIKHTS
ncbi:hypothetical protein [Rhizobium tropici]|uniref:hypothetical protein n=1 Tax=Rhizobium tropici TaxID=398 RepID=UPI001AEE264A|nr:hypothetical protein [Rhizobium tropici]